VHNLADSPVPVADVLAVDRGVTESDEWRQVTATGRYDDKHTVVVRYRTEGQSLNAPLRAGGIPHAATGGPQGRDTLVGEDGPEIVRLPSGATVYPNANTNQMMARGGGSAGGHAEVHLHITGDGPAYDWITEGLRTGAVQVRQSWITYN
jgi:hypothetical protein